jgi:hypothetical protein
MCIYGIIRTFSCWHQSQNTLNTKLRVFPTALKQFPWAPPVTCEKNLWSSKLPSHCEYTLHLKRLLVVTNKQSNSRKQFRLWEANNRWTSDLELRLNYSLHKWTNSYNEFYSQVRGWVEIFYCVDHCITRRWTYFCRSTLWYKLNLFELQIP